MRARWTCFVRSVFGLAERPVERRRRSVYQRPKASKSLKPRDILHLPLLTKGSSSVVNMSRKLTARGEQRRRELLAYATRAFASEGLHKTSVSQIRSEENTSELQSLMRTSYAVFCLKKHTSIKNT